MQIGDENVHRVRAVMDEVFGADNLVSQIAVVKTAGASSEYLPSVADHVLWFARNKVTLKCRHPYNTKEVGGQGGRQYFKLQGADGKRRPLTKPEASEAGLPADAKVFRLDNMTSQRPPGDFPVYIVGRAIRPSKG